MYRLSIRDALKMKLDQYQCAVSIADKTFAMHYKEFIRFYYPKRNSGMFFLVKTKPKLRGGNNVNHNTL